MLASVQTFRALGGKNLTKLSPNELDEKRQERPEGGSHHRVRVRPRGILGFGRHVLRADSEEGNAGSGLGDGHRRYKRALGCLCWKGEKTQDCSVCGRSIGEAQLEQKNAKLLRQNASAPTRRRADAPACLPARSGGEGANACNAPARDP